MNKYLKTCRYINVYMTTKRERADALKEAIEQIMKENEIIKTADMDSHERTDAMGRIDRKLMDIKERFGSTGINVVVRRCFAQGRKLYLTPSLARETIEEMIGG